MGNEMFELAGQIVKFMRVYRKFWLSPIILGLVALGLFLVATQGSALAPFIYTVF